MSTSETKILSYFKFKRIIIPIILGLGVATYLLIKEFDSAVFKTIEWHWYSYIWIFVAILLMGVRDLSYMYRIRYLTDNAISWRKSFDVIMLWEFSSAITPSVIGGSAIAFYIVNKEGVKMGKTTAIVMITALMDELFYILMVPIVFFIVGGNGLFEVKGNFAIFNNNYGLETIFFIGYGFIVLLTLIIVYGVFWNPHALKGSLIGLFKLPILRRWRNGVTQTGDDIITTSQEMKSKPLSYWIKPFLATLLSWTARFWVVNCLIMAFITVNNHFLIYARQLIMWVILLISPTPGGSGVAEVIFSSFLGEFINKGFSPALALLWRLISYYPYLFIGIIIIPAWLKRVYKVKKEVINNTTSIEQKN